MLLAAILVVALLTAIRPLWAVAAILAALPAFTHHPATTVALWLSIIVATFELAYLLRSCADLVWLRSAISAEPVLLSTVFFSAAAVASLSSLPLRALWQEHVAALNLVEITAWPSYLEALFLLPEVRPEFAVISAVLTAQAAIFVLILRREGRRPASTLTGPALAIIVGMVTFITLGLMESFGLVDLTLFRGETFIAYRPGTLQSISGNPGWFSQYVVYALPYGLVLLALDAPMWYRVAAVGTTTAIGVVGLAAAFQRGGWVIGFGEVVYVTAATALWLHRHHRQWLAVNRRRLVTFAAGAASLAFLGVLTWTAAAQPDAPRPGAGAFLARLASIATANRLVYAHVGLQMAALHPILGAGHESFALRYLMYYQSPGGALASSGFRVPDPASAHSVYVQTLAGTGVVGLAALLAMFATAASATVRSVFSRTSDSRREAIVLAAFGSTLGVAGYGLVQEVFYIHALRLLFFAGVGLIAAVDFRGSQLARRVAPAAWIGLVGLLAAHLTYEYVWPGEARFLTGTTPTGLSGVERGPAGETFQWSTIVATWPVPIGSTKVSLLVRSVAPFSQSVKLSPCATKATSLVLGDHEWHRIEGELTGCDPKGRVFLRTAPGWRPSDNGGLLGVMVAGVDFQAPQP